ncbi:hypothetical protein [Salipaludibacillus sp. CF4.18]
MEIIFKRNLTPDEKETIRQFAGFYRGVAVFENPHLLKIHQRKIS